MLEEVEVILVHEAALVVEAEVAIQELEEDKVARCDP